MVFKSTSSLQRLLIVLVSRVSRCNHTRLNIFVHILKDFLYVFIFTCHLLLFLEVPEVVQALFQHVKLLSSGGHEQVRHFLLACILLYSLVNLFKTIRVGLFCVLLHCIYICFYRILYLLFRLRRTILKEVEIAFLLVRSELGLLSPDLAL